MGKPRNSELAAVAMVSVACVVAAVRCCKRHGLSRREWAIEVLEDVDTVDAQTKHRVLHAPACSRRPGSPASSPGRSRPTPLDELSSPATSSADPGKAESPSAALAGSPASALMRSRRKRPNGVEPSGMANLVAPADAAIGLGVEERARELAANVWREELDVQDKNWMPYGRRNPLELLTGKKKSHDQGKFLLRLAEMVLPVVAAESTLLHLPAPAKIFGDLHGQLRDLLLLLHSYGFPSIEGPTFVFNGDFVDRGHHQPEVLALLFAFKLAYPRDVFLLRGNHEDADMNEHMGHAGFKAVCQRRFGESLGKRVFEGCSRVFDQLPLAAVLEQRILVLHGGLGNGQWCLEQLEAVKRPLASQDLRANAMVYNVLWSDPMSWRGKDNVGVHKSPRDSEDGIILVFGRSVTREFCIRNGLSMVVRSHQISAYCDGYAVQHGGRLVRVFSARDYETANNDGAILSIEKDQGYRNGLAVRPQQLFSLNKRSADPEF